MTVRLSTGLRKKMIDSTGMRAAFAAGVIYIYSGPQPADADSAVSGTLLGKVTVSAGAFSFGTSTNGLNFDAATSATLSKAAAEAWQMVATAAGTAGWFRLMGNASDALGSSTTLARLDGSIATSGADLNLPNIDFIIGTPVTIDTFSFTLPAA